MEKANYIYLVFLILAFTAGFFVSSFTGFSVYNANTVPIEKPTPGDWVGQEKIKVYDDKIQIDIKNGEWSKFTNTHSMEPIIGANTNAIEVKPVNEDSIKVGDIISYSSKYGTILHRVVEKGFDENGVYFVTKGDNNPTPDAEKVRFEQIQRVVIAIIY